MDTLLIIVKSIYPNPQQSKMKILKNIFAIPLSILAVYLCFAFVVWSLDVSAYKVKDRALIISLGLLVGVGFTTFPKQS